jgi:ribonuclease HI
MKITLITDASVNSQYHRCGYGFYIGCAEGKLQKAGLLRLRSRDVVMAELHCIANGLHTLKHSKFKPVSAVWIWCDNLHCVNIISGEQRGFRDPEHRKVTDEIWFLMMEICMGNGKTIRDVDAMFKIQHVKAHTGREDKISKINEWCDQNARKYVKGAVTKAKKNGEKPR